MKHLEPKGFTRRQFLAFAGTSFCAPLLANDYGIVPTMVDEAARSRIEIQPLRRNISMLQGSGANITVLTGRDGKFLVDAGFGVSQTVMANALASLGDDPIKHVVNTHWHTDHTDGNAWLHDAGAAITAHENTRKRLSTTTRVEGWNWTFPAAPKGALPSKTFTKALELRRNNTRIVLKYYSPAHTDGDISVYFSDADILHVGDTWWNGVYPFIDYSTGGSIDGQIRAAEANIAAVTANTIVIPGHGAPGTKSDLVEFRDMLVTIRQNVAALKTQGRSLTETIAAKPTTQFDGKWGQFLITPATFTRLVYAGV